MQFRDKEYYAASMERMRQAQVLYARGDAYALAMYCGGLAVECLLRAFRWKADQNFEGRHDLNDLLKASAMLRADEDRMRRRGESEEKIRKSSEEFRGTMNEVVTLWHNNFRFASEARLKAHLTQINRVQGIRGNPLKKNAADLIHASQLVVNRGVVLWTSQKK
jgi:hypothetical protein